MDKSFCWAYDIETYPNFFSVAFQNLDTNQRWIFEISARRYDAVGLWHFLKWLQETGCSMIGYNNFGFDYPVIHEFLIIGAVRPVRCEDMYRKAQAVIDSPRNDWTHTVWESDQLIPQIDPYKVMHFDNFARATSLKKLEVAMRSATVKDLPVEPGTPVPEELYDDMIDYMCWDVSETAKFTRIIWDRIEFRMQLDQQYGGRTRINFNDTKIGKEFFIDELRKQGISTKTTGGKPTQTLRLDGIQVSKILIPIEFHDPELIKIYQFFQNATIPADQTKGFFKNVSANVRGFQMDFGSGGIHGSIHKRTVRSDETHIVIDADVTSYYPSLAIKYGFYPEHLTDRFVPLYADLLERRKSHPKGSAPNAMLKLALNGTYGESNNKYSSFYDSQFTMSITINGQLLLAKLMEMLLKNHEVEPIQMNTDGLTVRLPRTHMDWYYQVCDAWQAWSKMDLEYANYDIMAIRDVNNYIAVYDDGKVKRKNAYLTEPDWHQDHSALVVPKAVTEFVENGTRIEDFIMNHTDAWDFMMSVKVPRSAELFHGDDRIQNVTRYHIGLVGEQLTKIMDKGKPEEERRRINVQDGWKALVCNEAWDFNWNMLNRPYYISEARKLLTGLGLN